MEKALQAKNTAKAKKPNFVRQDSHKRSSFKQSWRRPRGLQSKLRLKIRGKGKKISAGYRSPQSVKNLTKDGLQQVNISTVSELAGIDPKTQGVVINSQVGDKKKVAIIKEAETKKIKILNIKNPAEYVKQIESKIDEKKKVKEEKAKKAKAAEKKKEDKKLADKVTEEEKKEQEKQEKDKVLTKRER